MESISLLDLHHAQFPAQRRVYILDCQNARVEFRAYPTYVICLNMVFVSYVHVLSAAFLMGLASAAPMGPVNMLAIRRGVIGGWPSAITQKRPLIIT